MESRLGASGGFGEEADSRTISTHTKGRGEVSGGGKKPWKQKGTGRARHGSTRSPIWRHGGTTHGPNAEEDFTKKINKKMKRIALFSLLSKNLSGNDLKIVDSLKMEKAKAKTLADILKNVMDGGRSAVVISSTANAGIRKAGANLNKIGILSPLSLNVGDLLKYKKVILEKDAVKEIEKHYLKGKKEE
ncbi:MAG: 50S ribosomal protein L4 [Candidatus Wolfebacteria bacterium]|nr:50S ribosomal protein L4 [Candidatus Wolfebacteria bacterium]